MLEKIVFNPRSHLFLLCWTYCRAFDPKIWLLSDQYLYDIVLEMNHFQFSMQNIRNRRKIHALKIWKRKPRERERERKDDKEIARNHIRKYFDEILWFYGMENIHFCVDFCRPRYGGHCCDSELFFLLRFFFSVELVIFHHLFCQFYRLYTHKWCDFKGTHDTKMYTNMHDVHQTNDIIMSHNFDYSVWAFCRVSDFAIS